MYRLVAVGELAHVRVSNAIRVSPAEVAAFVVRSQKGVEECAQLTEPHGLHVKVSVCVSEPHELASIAPPKPAQGVSW